MPDTNADPRSEARLLLRQWLTLDESEVLARIDALGRGAVAAAAQASARLERGVSSTRAAERSLQKLQQLAAGLDAPAPRARSFFRRAAPQEPPQGQVEKLVETLDAERDAVARSLITIDTDLQKLRAASDAVDRALDLIRACAAAAEAAARELPDRTTFLRETLHARLLSREQDIATQAAVTHQGILTLQLLRDSQEALAQALSRARDTSVAALRTAIAARSAVAGSQDLARQTEALAHTLRAAEAAPAGRGDIQRVLDDAVEQAHRAIAAAGRSPL